MLSLRRRHSRWRMFPILLLLGMICSGELAPISVPEETSSASSSTSKKKDIGSLIDQWQEWIMLDAQNLQPGMESATLTRKIQPKSVFVAPPREPGVEVLPDCAEDYHSDNMGRCVKNWKSITINTTAQKEYIRKQLINRFANASKNDQKKSTGPLQLNIPLVPDINHQLTNVRFDEASSTNKPVAVPTRNETYFTGSEEKTKPHEITLYEVKNDTTLNEEESAFFLENSSVRDVAKIDRIPPATVSIEELIEKTNDTNFSKGVDYKISVDLKTLLNSSSVKRVNASIEDGVEESISITEKRENSSETPPALVLLISPTKLTNVVDDLPLTQNDTAEQITQMSNFTSDTTTRDSITVEAPDSTALPPAKQPTSIPLDEQRDNETYAEDELAPETSKPNESQEADFIYDQEEDDDGDYPYSTDMPDDEDSTEGDEILKHGEAGMTIPTREVERLDRDRHQRQRNQTADLQKKMLNIGDQVMIRFNDSAPTENKDEAGSNISSEVSIDGDFIVETTLLDVNTERLQVTTQSSDVTEKIVKDSENGSKESFGKNPDIVPEVVFSEGAHGAVSTNSHGREQTENERNEELEAAPSSSESLLYDLPEEDPITEIHTIKPLRPVTEKRLGTKESMLQQGSTDSQSNVPVGSSKRTTMNLDSTEDFVRFPDYMRPQQSNYVRFPSSVANSIHSLRYKQDSPYPADDVGPSGGTSTKSSVSIRQKPIYYLTASSWMLDRSQPDHIQTTASERPNRRSDLMHFWSKMPLIRDPAIYQDDEATDDDQKQSYNRYFRGRSSRRLSPFTGTSPGNRVPTQKRRTPIGV